MDSYLVYLACRFTLSIFRRIPRGIAVPLIRLLASIAYWIDFKHRRISRTNLRIAFPELSASERDRIGRKSFQTTALNLLEMSRLNLWTPATIPGLVVYDNVHGLNNYRAAVATGKPLLYLTGHFSAWELLPAAHALYGYPLSFVTRPLDNPHLETYLLRLRQAAGNRVLSKKNSARRILEELKRGGPVGLLIDQNTTLREGIFAELFGVPAATTTSLALLALRTDAAVLPGYLTPFREGRYLIKFLPPLDLVRSGDMAADIQTNTQLFNQVLERIIRESPESWLWGHKRWKNQPEGNPDIYSLSENELESFLRRTRSAAPREVHRQASE